MKTKSIFYIVFLCSFYNSKAQTLYFPPTTGTTWDTISPASLGWCQQNIDTFYNYLQSRNTDAFIILKDGKIVLEKYFGTATATTIHYWASAGKSLSSMLVGVAQEHNLININNPVSNYLGMGWTSEPSAKESLITVRNLLTMTSCLNPAPLTPCTNEDTSAACLQYYADAGTHWAYHTGAYKKVQAVVSTTSGLSYNTFTSTYVGAHIGMPGTWVNGVFYSVPRGMARYGLLNLNKGIWANDTILHDTAYYNTMTNTSQTFNLSYGYLWWLNGKNSHMMPQSQTVYSGSLIPNAPADMFCALGKNDQKIFVVPSLKMVVIRMGNSAYGVADASSPFDNELWGYINNLSCTTTGVNQLSPNQNISIYPNPFINKIELNGANGAERYELRNSVGQIIWEGKNIEQKDFSYLKTGLYFLRVLDQNSVKTIKLMKQ